MGLELDSELIDTLSIKLGNLRQHREDQILVIIKVAYRVTCRFGLQDELEKACYGFNKLQLLDVTDVIIVQIEVAKIRRFGTILNPSEIVELRNSVVAQDYLLKRMQGIVQALDL